MTRTILCLAGMGCLLWSGVARGLEGTRVMGRYLSREWGAEQGLDGGRVSAVAQTPDGYLWVGTEQGLLRFDGMRFTPMHTAKGPPVGHVTSLTVDVDGALWILTEDARLLRYAAGKFTTVLSLDDGEEAVISVARALGKGVIADGLSHGVVHLYGSTTFGAVMSGIPIHSTSLLISLAETPDGRIWLGTRESGLQVWQNGRLSTMLEGIPDMKINCLLPTADGQLWIGTDSGLAKWDGHTVTAKIVPNGTNHLQILTMVQDKDGSLWAGTSRGLLRYTSSGVDWVPRSAHNRDTAVSALLQDREGDLWFGDGHGLERLRDSTLLTYGDSESGPGDQFGATYVDDRGRAWFAPLAGGLFWMKDGVSHRVSAAGLDGDVVYSIDGRGDDLWVGRQRGGLTRLHVDGDRVTPTTWTTAEGLAQNSAYAVRVVRDGSVWVGTLTGGVSHLAGGRFVPVESRGGLLYDTVGAIEEGGDGTLWFGTPTGLKTLRGSVWKSYGSEEGLPSTKVLCLLAEGPRGMWVGTSAGLAYLEDGKVRRISGATTFHEPVLGMAADGTGRLWMTTSTHVLSLSRTGLLTNGTEMERVYGLQDGLQSTEGVQRSRSVVRDSTGRVWLTTGSGLSMTSPFGNDAPVAALAQVEAVSADGLPLGMSSGMSTGMIIPSGAQRVAIDYTGLDLRDPERVRFRYRLDGFDKSWGAPTADRQAIYTNLPPANYRFRVMASDGNGGWSATEAVLPFRVKPFLWQRRGFQLACLGVLLLIAIWIYRARLQHLIAQADLQSEERLIERTRIARELHDTLLQSFISALLHLHVTMETVPGESPLRKALQEVLEVMERVVEEARLAVIGLRTFGEGANLEQLFRELLGELGEASRSEYSVQVEGDARLLQPVAYEEICRIGREAILNATHHANARAISIRLHYGTSRFELEIVDDGVGMDPGVLLGGREGHWGIAGMRERSNRVGGQMSITSRPGAGTRVLLSVPGSSAYARKV